MPTTRYFHISNGLRGGYYPDHSFVVAVKTRRELKAIVAHEFASLSYQDDSSWDYENPPKRALTKAQANKAIAYSCALKWRNAKTKTSYLPVCVPVTQSYGLFLETATREDFLADQKSNQQ